MADLDGVGDFFAAGDAFEAELPIEFDERAVEAGGGSGRGPVNGLLAGHGSRRPFFVKSEFVVFVAFALRGPRECGFEVAFFGGREFPDGFPEQRLAGFELSGVANDFNHRCISWFEAVYDR